MKQLIRASGIGAMLLTAGVALAQTTTGTSTGTTTPGVPETGAGDPTLTLLVLAAAAVVALVGGIYLVRQAWGQAA